MANRYGTQKGVREIVLTFDDGPNPRTTPVLLDILKAYGISAVFFVVGQNISTQVGRDIVKRAHQEGHLIGNHSYSHKDLKTLTAQGIRDELHKTQELIGACGHDCRLFRPPYGSVNVAVNQVVQAEGYMTVLWNVDTLDWKLKANAAWVPNAMDQIRRREDSIVLMHDIHASTVNNVTALIDKIRRIPNTVFSSFA